MGFSLSSSGWWSRSPHGSNTLLRSGPSWHLLGNERGPQVRRDAPAPGEELLSKVRWLASLLLLFNVIVLLVQWQKPVVISGMFFLIPAVAFVLC